MFLFLLFLFIIFLDNIQTLFEYEDFFNKKIFFKK